MAFLVCILIKRKIVHRGTRAVHVNGVPVLAEKYNGADDFVNRQLSMQNSFLFLL